MSAIINPIWPNCLVCEGNGLDWAETCACCGGSGRDPQCCAECEQPGVTFNDDGDFLCEDCFAESVVPKL